MLTVSAMLYFFLCCLLLLRAYGPELMSMHTHQSVQKALGSKLETEHVIAYFSGSHLSDKERLLLREDIDFRYHSLKEFFNEDPVKWKGRKTRALHLSRC